MPSKKRDPRALNGFLGGRPAMQPDKRRVQVSVSLAPWTLKTLDTYAEANGISRGAALDQILLKAFGP